MGQLVKTENGKRKRLIFSCFEGVMMGESWSVGEGRGLVQPHYLIETGREGEVHSHVISSDGSVHV